jgi:hypothetical protein
MKPRTFGLVGISIGITICLALPALGQVTVSMPAGATGTGTWNSPEGDVYTGIYTGTVSGLPGANPGIICDDYNDTVTPPEVWTATALQVSSLNVNNINQTMFGSTIGLQGYLEVATLVSDMFSGNSGYTPTELSSAIWYITSGGFGLGSQNGFQQLDKAAQALVTQLQNEFGSLSTGSAEQLLAAFTNLYILTPSSWPAVDGQPQEMFVSVAEGGAALMYLLLGALFCFWSFSKRNRERLSVKAIE